ncbi:unnamed protein product [Bemisia tabaci]|uniref:Lipase domain-containing protein n=2 Tax=Bemisia tabaci TaxID=7038 RepID=A0A9P0FZR9_BEMTA|nr:unnamed protein product [Bemisia tabaci]
MRTDANVISVDWSFGGKGINYMQSVSNTRVVAAEISRLLNHLIAKKKLRADRVHLIGQSLGAHIMAYVGNNVTGIARITGLDPAQPGFEGDDPAVYLDASDAKFVDIIHTNADPFVPNGGLGFIQPTGHVDFYMNGGRSQPGCPGVKSKTGPITLIINTVAELLSTPIEMLVYYASCSHGRSYEYFIEAYTSNCTFWGRKWNPNTPEPPEEACRPDTCSALGQYTDLHSARGSFYVTTNQNPPFCIQPPDVPLDRLINNVKVS